VQNVADLLDMRELELFQSAIAASELPFHVLHVFGPGGVGKTSLLRQFIHICNSSETQLIYVDARIEPTAESLISALRTIMGLNAPILPTGACCPTRSPCCFA